MEINLKCENCGSDLKIHKVSVDYSDDITIEIEPCDKCLANSRKEGWDEGHEEGYNEGLKQED